VPLQRHKLYDVGLMRMVERLTRIRATNDHVARRELVRDGLALELAPARGFLAIELLGDAADGL
jgi:hypothetical protein